MRGVGHRRGYCAGRVDVTDLENNLKRRLNPAEHDHMRIARVYPRRTRATPVDSLAFTDGPGLFPPEVDEVHVSVTFTYDLPRAEHLARQWESVAPVKIGGPGTGMRGGDFTPGMYLRPGYVITSRGCPNRCWFCSVPKRDGDIRELPITEGRNVLDDNLLACSDRHIESVLLMLKEQKRAAEFTGGIEAARLTKDLAEAIRSTRPKQLFLAYDTADDWPPLQTAAANLWAAGFTKESHAVRCYVLCGYPKDRFLFAEDRMYRVLDLGLMPMAMLWRDESGKIDPLWRTFQRIWARPQIVGVA